MAHRIVFSVNDERWPPPPPPPPAEPLSFNLCAVISLHRQWNWCALFPLIKSKSGQGAWLHGGRTGGKGPGARQAPNRTRPICDTFRKSCAWPIAFFTFSQLRGLFFWFNSRCRRLSSLYCQISYFSLLFQHFAWKAKLCERCTCISWFCCVA